MRWTALTRVARGAVLGILACLGSALTAISQQTSVSSSTTKPPLAIEDPLQELTAKVRELGVALNEMREQIAQSRREAQQLDLELEAARGQLASFQREITKQGSGAGVNFDDGVQNGSQSTAPGSLNDPGAALDRRMRTSEEDQQS